MSHRTSLPLLLALVPATVLAQPPAGYYDAAQGLSGLELRIALRNIIDDHTVIPFNNLWAQFPQTDAKDNGKVWDVYSDGAGYEFTFFTDQCGQYTAEGQCYNREHSFPKSWFGDLAPMNSDLFQMYPTDGYVNNRRDNHPFANVGSVTWASDNGSKLGSSNTAGYSGTAFEPIDAFKGDFARTYFYMYTRYWGQTASWSTAMQTGADLAPWARTLLLAWNALDPVSTKEQDRNNAVFGIQHNRNPFIDDPQWANAIWAPGVGLDEVEAPVVQFIFQGEADLLLVLSDEPVDGILQLFDLSGRTLLTRPVQGTRAEVALDIPHGVFAASLFTAQGRTVQRFVH